MYVKIRYNFSKDDESIYECDTLKWSTSKSERWLLLYRGNQEHKFLFQVDSMLETDTEVFIMNGDGKTVDSYHLVHAMFL